MVKRSWFSINKVVTREYTTKIHKCIHEVGFKVPWAHKEIQKFAMKEIGTPDVHTDTKLYWAEGIRNLYMLVTYIPVCHHF
ncbi:hypothetical protein FD754_019639 [Muntiacus muntjak]|uniref:Uncharacterized protein n=1 Tax=Muntiacus muntjak TaxID=9888 RepID=A0A5N3V0R1_MUNMU|nr:hypothetical protein FD754_019639 [Muntiacus muntjak]